MWVSRRLLESMGVLTGKDAERFVEDMKDVKPISKEEREAMEANYKAMMNKAEL